MIKLLRFKLLVIVFLFSFSTCYSQEFTISGKIVDSLTNEVLPYSSIIIKNKNDSIIKGTYSDLDGNFSILVPTKTEGFFCASFVGYKKSCEDLNIYKGNNKCIIKLIQSAELINEVKVESKGNTVINKIDRTVFLITDDKKKQANTVYDILKTLPGVVVDDVTKSIRFKGGQPEVLADNMPTSFIYPKLEMINLDQIESIELIDRSALYGGEGAGGIINIKFKKQKPDTFGSFVSNETTYTPKDKQISFLENFLNVNCFLSPFFIFNNFNHKNELEINDTKSNGNVFTNNLLYNKSSSINSNLNKLNITDYCGFLIPAENAQILFAYGYENGRINKNNITNQQVNNTGYENNLNEISNKLKNAQTNYYLSKLFFTSKKGYEFSFTYTSARLKGNSSTDYNQNYNIMQNNISTDSSYLFGIQEKVKNIITLYDFYYNQPINKVSRLNIHGSRLSEKYPENSSRYLLNQIDYLPLSFASVSKQSRTTLGVNYSINLSKFSIDGTLNYVYSNINADFTKNVNLNDTIIKVSINNSFYSPSLRLKYKINKSNDISLGYSYTNKIGAPENYVSFIDKQNPLNWNSGNPDLKPEYYHNLYSSYRLIKDSLNFTIELFYHKTINGITLLNIPLNSSLYITRPENIALNQQIGSDISFWYQCTKQLSINLNSTVNHSYFKTQELSALADFYQITSNQIKKKQFGVNSKLTFSYRFKYKKSGNPGFGVWLKYNSKEIVYTGYNYPFFDMDFAISKRFFKEHLFINLSIENIVYNFIEKKSNYQYLGINSNTLYDNTENKLAFRCYIFYIFKGGDRGSKDIKYN